MLRNGWVTLYPCLCAAEKSSMHTLGLIQVSIWTHLKAFQAVGKIAIYRWYICVANVNKFNQAHGFYRKYLRINSEKPSVLGVVTSKCFTRTPQTANNFGRSSRSIGISCQGKLGINNSFLWSFWWSLNHEVEYNYEIFSLRGAE